MKKFLIILCAMLMFSVLTYSSEAYVKGKVLQIEKVLSPEDGEEEIKEIRQLRVKVLSGEYKSEIVPVDFTVFTTETYNMDVRVGDNVVLYYNTADLDDGNEEISFEIADIDRRNYTLWLVGIFVACTLIFARTKGLKGIIALLLVVVFIYKFFIPAIVGVPIDFYIGFRELKFPSSDVTIGIELGHIIGKILASPIRGAVITAIFSSVVTIFLMTGFKRKGKGFGIERKGTIAIIGSVGGVTIAGILSYIFVYKMRLTGYVTTDILNYVVSYSEQVKNIDFKEVISCGVIIGSMGAVMDIAMSISSALNELREQKPSITAKELFMSGMNIGGDVIGTMVNTLVLAYIGSSLATNMLLTLQSEQYPIIRILNFESVVVDILRAFCGSIGILVAVPLTSYIGSKIYTKTQ
ncbi:YibE/F family protein [Fusobacterium sp. PH5-44]|uniref:YibE/F family protein n=1 Tax=unclassified Fusobacterium TaxID=2648384 RepID=UPI003D1BB3CA